MICVLSSTHAATGGTELLQQLCYQLRNNGIEAAMYYTEPYDGSNVKHKFEALYNNPSIMVIPPDSIAVCPETEIDEIIKIQKEFSSIYIWWLSVDNYYGSGRAHVGWLREIYRKYKHHRNIPLFHNTYHLFQSHYAYDYIRNELGIQRRVERLSDYLNLEYIEHDNIDLAQKKNTILYNPKKGFEFTSKLMAAVPEYEWIALEGFTNSEMKKVMLKAKLYVDFGNHPGKDRIPREAAMNYCCVITGMRGAAANDIDIPISRNYKFVDKAENIQIIHDMISHCMEDYDSVIIDFAEYRKKISAEPGLFIEDVCRIFDINNHAE